LLHSLSSVAITSIAKLTRRTGYAGKCACLSEKLSCDHY